MFSIQGIAHPGYDPAAGKQHYSYQVIPTTEVQKPAEAAPADRRRMPDRRFHNRVWVGPDRRRRSRRAPLLLNGRSHQPEQAESSKGRLIDLSV